jgi:hypothetical protein
MRQAIADEVDVPVTSPGGLVEPLAAYKRLAAESRRSLSGVIQDALREALALREERGARAPVRLTALPQTGGLLPGVDLSSNVALTEALEKPADDELRRRLHSHEPT